MLQIPTTDVEWAQVSDALTWLWLTWITVILFAGFILAARAMLPSLIATGSVPTRAGRMSPLLYVVAAVFLALAIVALTQFLSAAGFAYDVYDEPWN